MVLIWGVFSSGERNGLDASWICGGIQYFMSKSTIPETPITTDIKIGIIKNRMRLYVALPTGLMTGTHVCYSTIHPQRCWFPSAEIHQCFSEGGMPGFRRTYRYIVQREGTRFPGQYGRLRVRPWKKILTCRWGRNCLEEMSHFRELSDRMDRFRWWKLWTWFDSWEI